MLHELEGESWDDGTLPARFSAGDRGRREAPGRGFMVPFVEECLKLAHALELLAREVIELQPDHRFVCVALAFRIMLVGVDEMSEEQVRVAIPHAVEELDPRYLARLLVGRIDFPVFDQAADDELALGEKIELARGQHFSLHIFLQSPRQSRRLCFV